MNRLIGLVAVAALGLSACQSQETRQSKVSMFIGIDVSGSFYNRASFRQAIDFLSYYIYGHLNGVGGMQPLKAWHVGAIGGRTEDEPKAFRPIEDFRGKSVEQIRADLTRWYPKSDARTDFNAFFRQASLIAQKRNMALNPIEIVLVTDGVPDTPGGAVDSVDTIDFTPLEFLSRKVTLRLLYPTPTLCREWETRIPRQRVRLWTADDQLMSGVRAQLQQGMPLDRQDAFWHWVSDHVDYRVRTAKFRMPVRATKS